VDWWQHTRRKSGASLVISDNVMTGRAKGGQVVQLFPAKSLIRAMMGLQVIGTVAEPTPIPISRQTLLAYLTPVG